MEFPRHTEHQQRVARNRLLAGVFLGGLLLCLLLLAAMLGHRDHSKLDLGANQPLPPASFQLADTQQMLRLHSSDLDWQHMEQAVADNSADTAWFNNSRAASVSSR